MLNVKKHLKRTAYIKRYFWLLLYAQALFFITFFLLDWLFPFFPKIDYATVVYDNKGQVIHAFLSKDEKWRFETELEEISPQLKQTIIYKEDRHFYHHPGINVLSIGRALVKNVLRAKRTSGASTINMQVVRLLNPKKRTYCNKIVEIFRALQLNRNYSKDEILRMYLNLVPYGGNIEGVKAASIIYLQKAPNLLTLGEIVALSIIPNRPSSLRPTGNQTYIIEQRNMWLHRFADDKLFNLNQINEAQNEPFTATRKSLPKYAPHLSLILKQQGKSNIASTLDLNLQLKTEKLVKDHVNGLRDFNIHNAAVIVVDNKKHEIIAYIGSSDFFDANHAGQVNGAVANRQPGSALKPLIYGMCFDQGLLTPKRIITDVETTIDGFSPVNYNNEYNGYVSVQFALENSLNIPAVKALNLLGKQPFINRLIQCQFKQIKKDQKKLGLSMALGGCGVSLEEMTNLYAAFANKGLWFKNTTTLNAIPDTCTVLSTASSYMLHQILSKPTRTELPIGWESSMHMPLIAWKTGTSYGKKDAWSLGYNSNYTIGVWVGNFSGEGVQELSGANVATPLLFKLFNTIDLNNYNALEAIPNNCDLRIVCAETGLLPNYFCKDQISDFYIPLKSSMQLCQNQIEIAVNESETISYCMQCTPINGYKKKLYYNYEPEMQNYFYLAKKPFISMPAHNQTCERIFNNGAPQIVAPKHKTEYLIDKAHIEPIQLKCQVANDVKKVFWYVNNQLKAHIGALENCYFSPPEGKVKISCTDDKGRNSDIWITVKYVKI